MVWRVRHGGRRFGKHASGSVCRRGQFRSEPLGWSDGRAGPDNGRCGKSAGGGFVGDAFLGGANFDEAVADHFVEQFEGQHGIRVRTNRAVMQRLVFAAENAKIFLSHATRAELRVPVIAQKPDGSFLDFKFTLVRALLERIVTPLVERCTGVCEDVLQRRGLTPDQVDELVLVGGQTRMPAIRSRFTQFKRTSSEKDVHPDLAVAIGAAALGRNLRRGTTGLADVVPMPISVMLQLGAESGNLFGVYLQTMVPEVPEFDDDERRLQWRFSNCRAQGTSNDELILAFA